MGWVEKGIMLAIFRDLYINPKDLLNSYTEVPTHLLAFQQENRRYSDVYVSI